jgi:NTP pyrophosphatase (non-canonical NTP hydrolase)
VKVYLQDGKLHWIEPEVGTATELELPPLSELTRDYFAYRGYVEPTKIEAFLFLVSEIGEMAGAIVQGLNKRWVRNHNHDDDNEVSEAGDVLMMLIKTMEIMGADPQDAMVEKWRSKGWKQWKE